jgi:hypothetical protein
LWTISSLIQQGRGLCEILFRNDPSTSRADRISSKICLSAEKHHMMLLDVIDQLSNRFDVFDIPVFVLAEVDRDVSLLDE